MTVSRQHRLQEAAARVPNDRSLVELMRVMDVAREVRKSREPAEQAAVDGEFRNQLRENLMRTARQAGDPVSSAEVDAAIDEYLANRHVYTDPPWSFSLLLAHLWVLRRKLLWGPLWLVVIVGGGLLVLWLLSVLLAIVV